MDEEKEEFCSCPDGMVLILRQTGALCHNCNKPIKFLLKFFAVTEIAFAIELAKYRTEKINLKGK